MPATRFGWCGDCGRGYGVLAGSIGSDVVVMSVTLSNPTVRSVWPVCDFPVSRTASLRRYASGR